VDCGGKKHVTYGRPHNKKIKSLLDKSLLHLTEVFLIEVLKVWKLVANTVAAVTQHVQEMNEHER